MKCLSAGICLLFLMVAHPMRSQDIFFNKIIPPEGKRFGHVTGIVQDHKGYMWFATKKGLVRYDGYEMISYRHDPIDSNSIASDQLEAICIDKKGRLYIGTQGAGLDQFDPATGVFTHFRHNPLNPATISGDWISSMLIDSEGQLWVGGNGLDRWEETTGRFVHYRHRANDTSSISSNE